MAEPLADPQARIDTLERLLSRMRHDVRSALAPAMLAADMLQTNADARAQRCGATVVRAVEKVMEMLEATRETVPPRGEK